MKALNLLKLFVLLCVLSSCSSDNSEDILPTNEPAPKGLVRIEIPGGSTMLDFKNVVKGLKKELEISIHNDGKASLSITKIDLPVGYKSDWESGVIEKQLSQTIRLTFSPVEEIEYSGEMIVNSDAEENKSTIKIAGKGVNSIYNGDILLSTQQELNDFIAQGYTSVTGSLCIGSCNPTDGTREVSDLRPLKNITSVNRLKINNTAAETLEGIEDINIETPIITMWNNNLLRNLDFFPSKQTEFILINLDGNQSLTNIDGLSHIISGSFWLSDHPELENINGLSNIKNLVDLRISGNPKIENLDPLVNVTAIDGDLSIRWNERLNNFCGLKPFLSSGKVKGTIFSFEYNRYNPHIQEIVEEDCSRDIPKNIYTGDIRFDTPSDIKSFVEMGFDKVDGDLIIFGDIEGDESEEFKIKDLSSLSGLKELTGALWVSNTDIENLKGLENLTKIGLSLQIRGNRNLTDYCDIVSLIKSPDFTAGFQIIDNFYNPLTEELDTDTCSK